MYKIKFSDRAVKEIADSWDWYEAKEYGVGNKFKNAVTRGADAILKAPFRYPVKRVNYREIKLKKFPFVLIYEILDKQKAINIVSVFHVKRNPASKY